MNRTPTAQLDPRQFASMDHRTIRALPAELGLEAVIEKASEWLGRPDATSRRAGLHLLGALALDHSEAFPKLLASVPTAATDSRVTVRRALARALGTHADERVRPGLVHLRQDDDPEVRVLVAAGLPLTCVDDDAGEREVAPLLIEMFDDEEDEVRDWATFALGVQMDIDTPEVREALAQRLNDAGGDTAGEAAVGLARRRDPRVLNVLLNGLSDPNVGNLFVEAAAHVADERLVPALQALKEQGWESNNEPRPYLLDEALEACRTGVPREDY
jgi:HEAT repeat protein